MTVDDCHTIGVCAECDVCHIDLAVIELAEHLARLPFNLFFLAAIAHIGDDVVHNVE